MIKIFSTQCILIPNEVITEMRDIFEHYNCYPWLLSTYFFNIYIMISYKFYCKIYFFDLRE